MAGIFYQLSYSCWKMLDIFKDMFPDEQRSVRLEGVEDLDVLKAHFETGYEYEFIQIKHSDNKMNSASFWEKNVLQNFAEVFTEHPDAKFRFVYDMPLADGYLQGFLKKDWSSEAQTYWHSKLLALKSDNKFKHCKWDKFDPTDFLKRIEFERISGSEIENECLKKLIAHYSIHTGNETQFLRALFFEAFSWSIEKQLIERSDLIRLIDWVKEDISKGGANPAEQKRWLSKVSFAESPLVNETGYFEGKAARPIHITLGLPIRRNKWEQRIEDTFNKFDITVIRSSSGQGKSTLAWQFSKHLTEKGFAVYEMLWCGDEKEIGNIMTLLEGRVKVGEVVVIVIDGLSKAVSKWHALARNIDHLPIKFIITAREEDWYRYGADSSQLRLRLVDIDMSFEEAELIYKQLYNKGKIHGSITSWQPEWEKVKERGLLIEYVYLLTKGEMIGDRLRMQIANLNSIQDGKAIIEILRLISLADQLNIKIQSKKLVNHIEAHIGFQRDRGEVLRSVEKEYYIQLDNYYVEGLHPVRSEHLSKQLHHNIPIEESLNAILSLVDVDYLFDYCTNAPQFLSEPDRKDFYKQLARHCSLRPYSETVKAIDGIFSYTVLKHWTDNKVLYDEAFRRNVIGIFALEALPWNTTSILSILKTSFGEQNENIDYLLSKVNGLKKYRPEDFDLYIFLSLLKSYMNGKEVKDSYIGLGSMMQWFSLFNIECPVISQITDEDILKSIKFDQIEDSRELARAYHVSRPKHYEDFVRRKKTEIISWLKRKTVSLIISEKEDAIYIKYILYEHPEKANDFSVDRIKTIYYVLPVYETYCTEAIIPQIVSPELFENVRREAEKRISRQNIPDQFKVHINQIWLRSIESQYEAVSIYDWQNEWYTIRAKALDFTKLCVRILEVLLQGNQSRIRTSAYQIDEQRIDLLQLLNSERKFPYGKRLFSQSNEFDEELKIISEWSFSFANFVNQFHNIVTPEKNNAQNIADLNIVTANGKLTIMQKSFRSISGKTFNYFPTQNLEKEELVWYSRLVRTIAYYINHQDSKGKLVNPRDIILQWWEETNSNRLNTLLQILKSFEQKTGITVRLPKKIVNDGILKQVVIGIENIGLDHFGDYLLTFAVDLADLVELDIHSISLVFIENNESSTAISISVEWLRDIKKMSETGESDNIALSSFGKPIPIIVTQEILESLEGDVRVKIIEPNLSVSAISDLLLTLWKLSEAKRWLDLSNTIEAEWLAELKGNCKKEIKEQLMIIRNTVENDEYIKYEGLATRIVDHEDLVGNDELQEYFNELITSVNKFS